MSVTNTSSRETRGEILRQRALSRSLRTVLLLFPFVSPPITFAGIDVRIVEVFEGQFFLAARPTGAPPYNIVSPRYNRVGSMTECDHHFHGERRGFQEEEGPEEKQPLSIFPDIPRAIKHSSAARLLSPRMRSEQERRERNLPIYSRVGKIFGRFAYCGINGSPSLEFRAPRSRYQYSTRAVYIPPLKYVKLDSVRFCIERGKLLASLCARISFLFVGV